MIEGFKTEKSQGLSLLWTSRIGLLAIFMID